MSLDKINGTPPAPAVIYEFKRAQSSAKADSFGARSDAAAITDDARRLSQAGPAVIGSPEVRPERVRELKAAIADGTYEFNDRDVAKKLLARGL